MKNLEQLLTDLQVAYDYYIGEPVDNVTWNALAKMMRGTLTLHNMDKSVVVCDATNNPPDVVKANDLVAEVWIDQGDGTFFIKTFNKGNSKAAKSFASLFGGGK